jgi:hypothetical protein
MNVSRWQGVVGLPSGTEQPFFRVVPDEQDVEDHVGVGEFRPFFYAAQENLEAVVNPSDCVIGHRDIGTYFVGYSPDSGRYVAPPMLRFCFPNASAERPPPLPLPSPSSVDVGVEGGIAVDAAYAAALSEDERLDEDREAFAAAECFLLETYRTLRRAFVMCKRGMASQTLAHGLYSDIESDAGAGAGVGVGAAEDSTALLAGDVLTLLRGAPRRQVTTITNIHRSSGLRECSMWSILMSFPPDPTFTSRRHYRMHWWRRTPSGMFGCRAMYPTSPRCCVKA